MKVIINGKMYNTDTAKKVGVWGNEYYYNNFNWCTETLYKKKTGEFFLHGEGGAATIYSVSCGGNSWRGGEKIIPLTEKRAKEWAEEKLDADEYINIFGTVEE